MAAKLHEDQTEAVSQTAVIGAEIKITGKIEASVDMMIDGLIDGDVVCKTLTIGENGVITGNVVAERARIAGKMDGTVDARDLAVEATGIVTGEATYVRLKVATGGVIEGSLKTKPDLEQKFKLVETSKPDPVHVVID